MLVHINLVYMSRWFINVFKGSLPLSGLKGSLNPQVTFNMLINIGNSRISLLHLNICNVTTYLKSTLL